MAEAGGEVLELYNLARDPGERHNLATRRWETVLRLKNIALNYYRWVHVLHRCLYTASFNIQSPAVSRELVPPRFLGLQTTKHVGYDGHSLLTSRMLAGPSNCAVYLLLVKIWPLYDQKWGWQFLSRPGSCGYCYK